MGALVVVVGSVGVVVVVDLGAVVVAVDVVEVVPGVVVVVGGMMGGGRGPDRVVGAYRAAE